MISAAAARCRSPPPHLVFTQVRPESSIVEGLFNRMLLDQDLGENEFGILAEATELGSMKIYRLSPIVVGVLAVALSGGITVLAMLLLQRDGPRLSFDETVVDFGIVNHDRQIEHIFSFTNRGDATLEILRVVSDCGCTVSTVTSRRLAPGVSGAITIAVEPSIDAPAYIDAPKSETVWREVRVFSNDPQEPLQVLVLKGQMDRRDPSLSK